MSYDLTRRSPTTELTHRSQRAVSAARQEAAVTLEHIRVNVAVAQAEIQARTDIAMAAVSDYSLAVAHVANRISAVKQGLDALELLNPSLSSEFAAVRTAHTIGCLNILGNLENGISRVVR